MYLEKRDVNLKGMIKVDYFEYNEEGSNPGVYMEIKYSELIKSMLYNDITKTNNVFNSVSDNGLCSFRGLISFFKELNGIDYNNNDFIISFRSSELLNDVSIDELNLYGIDSYFYSLLDDLLGIVNPEDIDNKLFSINDLKRALHRSELCLAFNLENLKVIEDTIKVFGKLLFNSLDTLSRKYIIEEI